VISALFFVLCDRGEGVLIPAPYFTGAHICMYICINIYIYIYIYIYIHAPYFTGAPCPYFTGAPCPYWVAKR